MIIAADMIKEVKIHKTILVKILGSPKMFISSFFSDRLTFKIVVLNSFLPIPLKY